MHRALESAASSLSIDLGNLADASDRTIERVTEARAATNSFLDTALGADRDPANEPIIAAFGSMAREEMARGSDFDYLVILNYLEQQPERIQTYRKAAVETLRVLGLDPPGRSGLFGCAISGADLVNTIGLDTDTNLHLSRRILLLEESVGLNAQPQHASLVETICARYLHEQDPAGASVPRFLLNDVIRYWRTVAVDYQAKRWDELEGRKWGSRYVKLISSRKLTFAGTVVSMFMPVLAGTPTQPATLRDQFEMPALARLAQLSEVVGPATGESLRTVLELANWFIGRLADAEFRAALELTPDPANAASGSAMHEAKGKGQDLQHALESLFFSNEPVQGRNETLGGLSRRYLSF